MTYAQILITLALAIPVAGFLTELLLRKLHLRGYRDIAGDVAAIARVIHGELDRDSGDLLIRGRLSSSPVLVRLSHSDQRPGLNIQVPAAGNLSLYCVPRGHDSAGRTRLHSPDPTFESRFRLSSNHPELAQMLFCTPATMADIQDLCRTSGTFLALEQERLELIELLIPEENLSQRALDAVRGMIRIAAATRQMPGAKPDRPMQFPRRWNWFRTAYMGVSVLLLSSLLLVARLHPPADGPQLPAVPSGMADEEARQIPEVQHWRLALPGDFDADAVAWLRLQGQEAKGSIRGQFAGYDREDSVYVLKPIPDSPGDSSRLVVFLKGQARFDANMPIAIAARVPKDRISAIEWRGRGPAGQPDGDGILVIQRYQDPSSAMVFFASGVQLVTGRPKDFHSLSLR